MTSTRARILLALAPILVLLALGGCAAQREDPPSTAELWAEYLNIDPAEADDTAVRFTPGSYPEETPRGPYWPDPDDLEHDIHTTCEDMNRPHCPYDTNHEQNSILCEWKAKGATNWMVRSTVKGYPYVTEGEMMSGDPLAAADWLRIAFHESGQFMWNGEYGTGDDGSMWYEANKETAPKIWAPNFELWEQLLDARAKVYRTVNRCGASVKDACRYPCEEVCEYKDTDLFSGFKPTGSAKPCDGESEEPEAPEEPEAELEPHAEDEPIEATRSASTSASSNSGARSAARPTSTARTSVRQASVSKSRDAGGDSPNIVDRPDQPGVSRHHHRDPDAYLIGDKLDDGFKTPFDQTRALSKLGKKNGKKKCYRVCRSDCEAAMSKDVEKQPGYVGYTDSSPSSAKVSCAVPFADVLQYAGASSVEVTGGPKLLRHIKPGRCDAKGPSEKFILPAATGQGVSDMVNTIPFFKKCHCAGPSHLVALTGAHTLGHAHSRHVGDSCVANSLPNTENARNLDATPDVFDNTYWKHVTRAECPKRRKHADRYDKCTAPYLTDTYAAETWPRLKPTKQNCAPPYEWENTDDSLWYDRHGGSCNFRRHTPQKCANITSAEKQNKCSSSVCGGVCKSPEDSTQCSCDMCDGSLTDREHCTGAASCGMFHSDHMLWATKETADEVGAYAEDQAKFFTNYAIAHVRMAHVGCEACGVGTDLYSNPCAAYDGGGHHGHHLG